MKLCAICVAYIHNAKCAKYMRKKNPWVNVHRFFGWTEFIVTQTNRMTIVFQRYHWNQFDYRNLCHNRLNCRIIFQWNSANSMADLCKTKQSLLQIGWNGFNAVYMFVFVCVLFLVHHLNVAAMCMCVWSFSFSFESIIAFSKWW